MLVKTYAGALQGVDAIIITVEVSVSRGIMFSLVGLPDTAIKESADRIRSAVNENGYKFPREQVVVNLAPADVRKEGASYDLPIALAILAASESIQAPSLHRYFIMGELSLDGTVKPVKGILPMAIAARAGDFDAMIVPSDNAREAAVVNNLKVIGINSLKEVIAYLEGNLDITPTIVDTRREFYDSVEVFGDDMADVRGQENVKRALEVAAAGGHNILMAGPPGAGKSMIARRLPSIMPPLTLEEALETTKIHSVAGKLGAHARLMTSRPFRAPHHTISPAALVGGGTSPMPGEISLAHNGVLFLDEFPEFPRSVLEVLRQPLEDHYINVSRVKYSVDYPARFMLVASMNPCPCGYYNHPTRQCTCTPSAVARYKNRISGPLLDRIDIHCEILPVEFDDLSSEVPPADSSADIRQRVIAAHMRQVERFKDEPNVNNNASMSSRMIRKYCKLDKPSMATLRAAMEKYDMSARAYDRILKVARTIADLAGSENILMPHIAEAISYRTLDRSSWDSPF